jgi:hypothetical protein
MRSTLRWLLLPVLSLWIASSSNSVIAATLPPEYDWLLKNVCADASNRLVAADPYYGCPAGTTERDIQIGEPLPYLNHDQPQAGHPDGYQRRDSYPVLDKSGNPLAVNAMDFGYDRPYGTFEAGDGDGYDLLTIRNGWASASETRRRRLFPDVLRLGLHALQWLGLLPDQLSAEPGTRQLRPDVGCDTGRLLGAEFSELAGDLQRLQLLRH